MRKLLLAATACVAVAATGCAERADSVPAVRIAPTIKTRVTGLHFDTGDRIGLTIVRSSGVFERNRLMTYDGSAFTSPGLLWYNDLHETSTLTAYYPYTEAGQPEEFAVATDQSAGCESSDLLAAVKKEVTPGSAPVGMLFCHVMSQLSILVENTSDAAVERIFVGGLAATATVDFAVPEAAARAGAAAAEIRAMEVTPDALYRTVLVPQQAPLTVTVHTADGKVHRKSLASALLESGRRYDLTVRVTNIDISLTLSGEINDWEDGGSLDDGNGSQTPDHTGGSSVSKDGVLEYADEAYRTTVIGGKRWMAENLRYMPEGSALGSGVWNPSGGTDAVATQGLLYNYATAAGGGTTRADAPLRGICPAGWHLPDRDELAALAASADRPADFFCCGGFWSLTGNRIGSKSKGYLMGATCPEQGKCDCLCFTSDGALSAMPFSVDNGLTVRCVEDTK